MTNAAEHREFIDRLLEVAIEVGASDLHLRSGEPPILRRDGEIQRLGDHEALRPDQIQGAIESTIPDRNRIEFAETGDADYGYEIPGRARFRVNVLADRNGPGAVFRPIPPGVVTAEQLGLAPELQRLAQLTKGLVIVTGPTGSGKSTTLCALLDLVNSTRADHIVTIEDPIEFVHPHKRCVVTQREVGVHTRSFKTALRAALREDPDVVLIGEMRDLETVSIALETAETGHLVFATLHTTTAPSTVDRIVDQFPADQQEQMRVMLADALRAVISQTLCKRIGGGRVAAREVLFNTAPVANLIRERKTFQLPSIMQTSRRFGMVTLNEALLELVETGQITGDEAYTRSVEKASLVAALKSKGLDTSFADGEIAGPRSSGAVPRVVGAMRAG
jgi:twitching motility protein PilT